MVDPGPGCWSGWRLARLGYEAGSEVLIKVEYRSSPSVGCGDTEGVDLSLFLDPHERSSGMASGVDSAAMTTYRGFSGAEVLVGATK